MRDYGLSVEEAKENFQEMDEIAWKDVKEGILLQHFSPKVTLNLDNTCLKCFWVRF